MPNLGSHVNIHTCHVHNILSHLLVHYTQCIVKTNDILPAICAFSGLFHPQNALAVRNPAGELKALLGPLSW